MATWSSTSPVTGLSQDRATNCKHGRLSPVQRDVLSPIFLELHSTFLFVIFKPLVENVQENDSLYKGNCAGGGEKNQVTLDIAVRILVTWHS